MKIFVSTTDIEDIKWAVQAGLVDGVMIAAVLPRHAFAYCQAMALQMCLHVTDVDTASIKEFADQVSVQVPLDEGGLDTLRGLRADGVRVIATHVTTTAQAILAAKAGASTVSIDVDALDRGGRDGTEIVRDVRALFDQHGTSCDVLAVGARNATQFSRCARAGADIVAVEPDLLHALLVRAAS